MRIWEREGAGGAVGMEERVMEREGEGWEWRCDVFPYAYVFPSSHLHSSVSFSA